MTRARGGQAIEAVTRRYRRRRGSGAARVLALGAALVTTAMLTPGVAAASSTQESGFQDDDLLIYNSQAGMETTLDTLQALGVQRVRVSVLWALVAPGALSKTRPSFDASDPAAYPPGAWNRYDALVAAAAKRGIAVNFDLMAPAPLWATGRPTRSDIENIYRPSADEFALFARAVGRRYSGSYTLRPPPAPPPPPSPPPDNGGLLGMLLGPNHQQQQPAPPPQPPGVTLPRVDYWSIGNEPNQGGWLAPQWAPPPGGGALVETSPQLYRGLLDAAWSGLAATGHSGDTILIGETAPKGLRVRGETRAMAPLPFVRALYCVDSRLRPLRGGAAADRGCPTSSAGTAHFAPDHPALFEASGWAHHPYELTFAPAQVPRHRDYVTIANLDGLTAALNMIRSVYRRAGGLPLYLTEFGYMTDPPNPAGVTPAQQAAYVNEAEFIAYSNPRVRSWSQFLLVDDRPLPGRNGVTSGYGATFQTGLMYLSGGHKPAFDAYRMAVDVPTPNVRRGHAIAVWGIVRNAPSAGAQAVQIQLAPARSSSFRTLASTSTRPRPAYFSTHVRLSSSGRLRIAWRNPASGLWQYSRVVGVQAR
jgi:hypothetical protein